MRQPTEKAVLERLAGVSLQVKALARDSKQAMFDGDDLLQEVCRIGLETGLDWSAAKNSWFIVTAMNVLKSAGRRTRCWRKYLDHCGAKLAHPTCTADPVEMSEAVEERFFSCHRTDKGASSTPRTRLRRAKLQLYADAELRSLHSILDH